MNTLNCAEVRDRLPDVGTARLNDELRAQVEQHLDDCDDCRAEFAFVGRLAGMPLAPAPIGLESRVREAIHAASIPAARRSSPWFRPSSLAMAASLSLLLGTPLLMRQMQDSTPSGPDLGQVEGESLEVLAALDDMLVSPWPEASGSFANGVDLDGFSDEELLRWLEETER
jgi:hypothetical protein